jgi:hypothetical protein
LAKHQFSPDNGDTRIAVAVLQDDSGGRFIAAIVSFYLRSEGIAALGFVKQWGLSQAITPFSKAISRSRSTMPFSRLTIRM